MKIKDLRLSLSATPKKYNIRFYLTWILMMLFSAAVIVAALFWVS